MQARHLVLRDMNGEVIKDLNVSDVDNANSAAQMSVTVETKCDLGEWHVSDRYNLLPWGPRISEPS